MSDKCSHEKLLSEHCEPCWASEENQEIQRHHLTRLSSELAEVEARLTEIIEQGKSGAIALTLAESRLREVEKENEGRGRAVDRWQLRAEEAEKKLSETLRDAGEGWSTARAAESRAESLSRELEQAKRWRQEDLDHADKKAEALEAQVKTLTRVAKEAQAVAAEQADENEKLEAQLRAKDEALKEAIDYLDGVTSVKVSAMGIVRRGRAVLSPAKVCACGGPGNHQGPCLGAKVGPCACGRDDDHEPPCFIAPSSREDPPRQSRRPGYPGHAGKGEAVSFFWPTHDDDWDDEPERWCDECSTDMCVCIWCNQHGYAHPMAGTVCGYIDYPKEGVE